MNSRKTIDRTARSRQAETVVAATKESSTARAKAANGAKGGGFDALRKLLRTGTGRSSVQDKAKAVIFLQGDPADALFWCRPVPDRHGKGAHGTANTIARPAQGTRKHQCRSA